MSKTKTQGGRRSGSGRLPEPDKKQQITTYVKTSVIEANGGKSILKQKITNFINKLKK